MPLSFLESLRNRRNPWLIAAAVALAAIALIGSVAWYTLREQPPLFAKADGAQPGAGDAGTGTGSAERTEEVAPPPAPVYVHVAGAVATPGVYKLADGQRVIDAIAAAGGGTADAAINSINLAQALVDGQRLYVPTKREAQGTKPGATFSGGKPFTPPADGAGSGGAKGGGPLVVNVNTATQEELDRVPGIGPVLAGRIILYRTANGPFQAVEDLTKVSGIGDKTLQDLKPYLTVK